MVGEVAARLDEIIRGASMEKQMEVIEMEIMPTMCICYVKFSRSTDLRSRLPALWTNASFGATAGGAPLEVIKQSIEAQKAV